MSAHRGEMSQFQRSRSWSKIYSIGSVYETCFNITLDRMVYPNFSSYTSELYAYFARIFIIYYEISLERRR